MQLNDGAGMSFRLTVVGYQFADARGHYDANWLNIQVDLQVGEQVWRKVDPSLLTEEAGHIVRWLEHKSGEPLAADMAPELRDRFADDVIGFLEPNLAFAWDAARLVLRVRLGAECRPPWSEQNFPWFEFPATPELLREVARDLDAQLRAFPVRDDAP